MRLVNFVATQTPCVVTPAIRWHIDHGWVWDVVETRTGRKIGVFYCTLLGGDGCVVHFESACPIPWAVTFSAFKKAMQMVSPHCNVVLATIPASKKKLIDAAILLGFGIVDAGYERPGEGEIVLLKYFGRRLKYIKGRNQLKEAHDE